MTNTSTNGRYIIYLRGGGVDINSILSHDRVQALENRTRVPYVCVVKRTYSILAYACARTLLLACVVIVLLHCKVINMKDESTSNGM